jgi:hypothetical protein
LVWDVEADTFVKVNSQDTRSRLALRLCGNELGSGWKDQPDLTHLGRIRTNAIVICGSRTACYAGLLVLHIWSDCRGQRGSGEGVRQRTKVSLLEFCSKMSASYQVLRNPTDSRLHNAVTTRHSL